MGSVTLWVRSDPVVTVNLMFSQDMGKVHGSQYESQYKDVLNVFYYRGKEVAKHEKWVQRTKNTVDICDIQWTENVNVAGRNSCGSYLQPINLTGSSNALCIWFWISRLHLAVIQCVHFY